MRTEVKSYCWWKMTIPLHFTLEIKGLKDHGSLKGKKPTWSPTWRVMDNV